MSNDFHEQIQKFNDIYRLPNHTNPTLLPIDRLAQFKDILSEELDECDDIAEKYRTMMEDDGGELSPDHQLEILTDMADWLGDLVVYCASEARRWGLPLNEILNVIMQSNFSKLDAKGEPIYDQRGKVMKGPNYWKPEPKIRDILTPKST